MAPVKQLLDLAGHKIFIAGATGMAGSAVVRTILDKFPNGSFRAAHHKTEPFVIDARIDYVETDLRKPADCRRAVAGCTMAVLAAATTSGAAGSRNRPWDQVNDNLVMNAGMLKALADEECEKVVFVSTASVYQPFEGFISETDLDLNADPAASLYGVGWTMRYLEKLCEFWHRAKGVRFGIIRAANIFGPYAKFDPSVSNFIPALIRKAVDGLDPFEVWGSPDVVRDVIFAHDFADAVTAILTDDSIDFEIFNVGSGVATTVGDVVRWATHYAPHKPEEIRYSENLPTGPRFRALNISKAKERLGWTPAHTPEQGVAATVEWWKNNKERWKK